MGLFDLRRKMQNNGNGGSIDTGGTGSGTSQGASDIYAMSESQLRSRAAQNSQAWFGADAAEQARLHNENTEINRLLDARNGTTTTYDSQRGVWTTQQRDTGFYDPAAYTAGDPAYKSADAFNGLFRDAKTGQVYAPTGVDMTGYRMIDFANDKTDYSAAALTSQSEEEIASWLARRSHKAEAQGVDISGADPRYRSNEEIYRQWKDTRGKYIGSGFRSWDGTDGFGYYGQDENGNYGYFADPDRTVKLANGNWGENPNNGNFPLGIRVAAPKRETDGAPFGGAGRPYVESAPGGYSGDALTLELLNLYRGQSGAYADTLAAQKAAQDAAVRRATDALSAQKASTNSDYAALYRQLYIDRMNAQKNIDQRLAAQGVTGGAAESTLLSLSTGYEDALRQGEQGRIGIISGIDRAITDAQLDGDIANAQAAAETARKQTDNYAAVLKMLIERYDAIAAREEAYAREDARLAEERAYQRERDAAEARARQETYARETERANRDYAYKTAMQLISSGIQPDESLLAAAGIDALAARSMVEAALAQQSAQAAKPKLTAAQVNAAIKAGRLTPEVLSAYEYWYGAPYRR